MIISFTDSFSQKSINSKKLLEDFDFAVQELQLSHQGFYNYEEKNVVDAKVSRLRGEINRPMTKLEFYQLTRRLLGVIAIMVYCPRCVSPLRCR